jgi:hypothetical protein
LERTQGAAMDYTVDAVWVDTTKMTDKRDCLEIGAGLDD